MRLLIKISTKISCEVSSNGVATGFQELIAPQLGNGLILEHNSYIAEYDTIFFPLGISGNWK